VESLYEREDKELREKGEDVGERGEVEVMVRGGEERVWRRGEVGEEVGVGGERR
jgi:hypothetical protein